jgi:hypothetical protein
LQQSLDEIVPGSEAAVHHAVVDSVSMLRAMIGGPYG